ncbi:MAG: hypothetical protein HY248_05220 [Fimbriimonas ginsengisoli]|uniref:Uncharacterized protein n=1 Tax=Fimbriimonas ginsengisoli TaxID=1005039 RepID=A0A931M1T1_FIMGI|nr:hypothetical protein [Fimbriimonas ginsengisoli]MBI3721936.1 hypothetical protein [Fimbriimonas ginsengisoli]
MPLYGNWTGRFEAGGGPAEMSGFLQLYATNGKFKMHLANRAQSLDPVGTWELKGRRVILQFAELRITVPTEVESKRHVYKLVPGDDLRAAYGNSLILELSSDGRKLTGLPIQLAGKSGRHVFEKTAQSSYVRPSEAPSPK